jgi:hypothetical protein
MSFHGVFGVQIIDTRNPIPILVSAKATTGFIAIYLSFIKEKSSKNSH